MPRAMRAASGSPPGLGHWRGFCLPLSSCSRVWPPSSSPDAKDKSAPHLAQPFKLAYRAAKARLLRIAEIELGPRDAIAAALSMCSEEREKCPPDRPGRKPLEDGIGSDKEFLDQAFGAIDLGYDFLDPTRRPAGL